MEKTTKFANGNNEEDMNYPIGIQTFEKIKNSDFAYVDKTAFVYRLASQGSCFFLSRPRRFGKSLLLSTLKSYFQGNKSADEALQQIEEKQYAAPFASDPRKLFKIGVCFSSEERGIKEWRVRNEKS